MDNSNESFIKLIASTILINEMCKWFMRVRFSPAQLNIKI
jgi:hypothetical protein